ncbi:MAG: hypothetical protein DHS20C17_26070 [Cyclobacteriaceae bacterium]|nr:MAG: hypothetical protein DHS20C17_26070 [Cyclobacteriaceae bacterium]
MNTLFKGTLLLGLILWSTTSFAQSTVTGEITDVKCYIASGAKGADHAKCAKACVSAGQPMGLLTAEGKLYILGIGKDKSQYESLKEMAGESAEVSGKASEKDGMNMLVVEAAKKSEG